MKIYYYAASMLLGLFIQPAMAINRVNVEELRFDFNRALQNKDLHNAVPGYQTSSPPYSGATAETMENNKGLELEHNETGRMILDYYVSRPQYDYSEDQNLINNAQDIINNKGDVLNKDYGDCGITYEYKICYDNVNARTGCATGKVINLNAYKNSDFQCKKILQKYRKTCIETPKLQCLEYAHCNNSGLKLASISGDLTWTYGNSILVIGKRSNANYWDGSCLVVDRYVNFTVENLNLIEYFALNRAVYDDHILVDLNGHTVYVSKGGQKLELTKVKKKVGFQTKYVTVVDYGNRTMDCELSTIWNDKLSINLTPYLQQGNNTLHMRVIVSGSGQGSMEFFLQNKCCVRFNETVEQQCDF